jgi:phage FluMu protein Com
MKKQARCLNCNARLFDLNDDANAHGSITIKCRRCATMNAINLELL